MPKHFIKITQIYATKNKAQELCLKELTVLDHLLCRNFKEAKEMIKTNFDTAINSYKGRAKLPELRESESDKKTTIFTVEDVIIIKVYEILNDFTDAIDN